MNIRTGLLLPAILVFASLSAQEICTNGVDDDQDGLIDLNDTTDCLCGHALVLLDSILPNPSFEEFACIPSSYSQLDCSEGWSQGTFSTSDYFMTQGYMPSWIQQPLPGGGSGCVGGYFCNDYMEYVGSCLLSPMLAGTSYDLHMWVSAFKVDDLLNETTTMDLAPVDITLFGLASCPVFPTDVSLCPGTEGWAELGHATYAPGPQWSEVTITFTPGFDVQAIMIGSPCTLPAGYPNVFDTWLAYFLMDELSIALSGPPGAPVTDEGNWCDGDLVLAAHPDSAVTSYQWYQNGVAITGASDTLLAVSSLSLPTGDYVFRAAGDTSCTLTTFHVGGEIEPTPYIALTVDGLWCPLPGTYQWYLNDEAIPGATDAHLVPTENGVYTVELTNTQGCSTISFPFNWISMAIAPTAGVSTSLLYSSEETALRVKGAAPGSFLSVTDASGRLIISQRLIGPDHLIPLANAAHGIYVARIGEITLRFSR